MGAHTTIEWTDVSKSPWEGCTKVSAGCAHCYAARRDRWIHGGVHWGKGAPRRLVKSFPEEMVRLDAKAALGVRMRVFPSICDWLDEEVPVEWLASFLTVVAECECLDWQLLTKRPEVWRARLEAVRDHFWRLGYPDVTTLMQMHDWVCAWLEGQPPEHVWVGVSVEDEANRGRLEAASKIPATVCFASLEPLLGPVRLTEKELAGLDWVIVGGESGPGARPCDVQWIEWIVEDCRRASVPVFVKQVGTHAVVDGRRLKVTGKGGDMREWPPGIQVRQVWPEWYVGSAFDLEGRR